LLLCLSGCWTTSSSIKFPRPPEEYILPPANDPRFCNYPTYPKDTLNNNRIKAEKQKDGLEMDGSKKSDQPKFGMGNSGF